MPKGPKLPHAQPPIQLPSGRWQGRVRYYDGDGKRHEQTQTFGTQRAANAWSRKREQELLSHPHIESSRDLTVDSFLTDWLEAMTPPRIQPETWRGYRSKLDHVRPVLGNRPLQSITAEDIQRLYGSLGEHLSAQSIVHVHRVFRQALQAAEEWEKITKNPARKVTLPKVPKPDLRIPTLKEARTLLRVAQPHRLYALWVWIALTGTRRGEALGLRWSDLDFNAKTARLQQALKAEGARRELGPLKTKDGYRWVVLDDYLVTVLKEHQARQREEMEALGSQWKNVDRLVFVAEQGQWLSGSNVVRSFKTLLEKASLPTEIRIHDLRHAMAVAWIARGTPIDVVAQRLGHADPGFTMRVYGHVQVSQQQAPADAVAKVLLGEDESTTTTPP